MTNVPTSTALVVRGKSTETTAVATSSEVECWNCKEKGHVRSKCPLMKGKNTEGIKRLGALSQISSNRKGPYLVVDVSSLTF